MHWVVAAAVAVTTLLAACSTPQPPEGAPAAATPVPLPLPPWRDDAPPSLTSGRWQWTDASRDRVITAQWHAPGAAAAPALLLVLPGLAQGSSAPPALIEALAGSGFAVVTIGHVGNDAAVWRSPEARRADFTEAARIMYGTVSVTERGADVRFVLDALEGQPPSWLAAGALRRVGVVGIGLGAQTAQSLLGEPMARTQAATSEPRIVAAALLGPYVGFAGPAMHQRYEAVVTPLLVAYGLTETDPYGLGMTSQQRRAMVLELRNARVTELRLPTSSLAGALTPGAAPGVATGGPPAPAGATPMSRSEPPTRGTRGPGGGTPAGKGTSPGGAPMSPGGEADTMLTTSGRPMGAASSTGERAARVALLLSVQAFFEAELLGSREAREWLEGPHPGPAQWTTYSAGRAR
jgi:dienelactone hydrolase